MTTQDAGVRYRFAYHAIRWHWQNSPRSRSRRCVPANSDFESVTDHNHLIDVFRDLRRDHGTAPGIDGVRYRDLSPSEAGSIFRAYSDALRARTYLPSEHRIVWVPKRSGGERELRLRGIVHRVISSAVAQSLSSTLEARYHPSSYAYRTGRSHMDLLAVLLRDIRRLDRWFIAQADIHKAFDFVRIDDAVRDFSTVTADESLLWLIETILRGHEGAAHRVGIDQGDPLSPAALNLRCTVASDTVLLGGGSSSSPGYRFSDNYLWLCRDMTEAREVQSRAQELLMAHGFELKASEPVNLRRQGSHVEFLGFSIRAHAGAPVLSLGPDARTNLDDSLKQAHESRYPEETALAASIGWINSYAPAFDATGADKAFNIVIRAANGFGFAGIVKRPLLTQAFDRGMAAWSAVVRRRGT
jgi:hypothetical protein